MGDLEAACRTAGTAPTRSDIMTGTASNGRRSVTSTPWRALGAGAGVLGAEGLILYLRPALGEVIAATDVLVPAAVGLALVAAILFGSKETCDRVFRLLRWISNRPEPPGPGEVSL